MRMGGRRRVLRQVQVGRHATLAPFRGIRDSTRVHVTGEPLEFRGTEHVAGAMRESSENYLGLCALCLCRPRQTPSPWMVIYQHRARRRAWSTEKHLPATCILPERVRLPRLANKQDMILFSSSSVMCSEWRLFRRTIGERSCC